MAEGPLSKRRRVFVEDARRNGMYVRTTWHGDERQFVVSTWHDELCTGAVRIPVESVPELTSLLIDGLAAAAASGPPPPTKAPPPWWRRWFARGTDLAPVVALRRRAGGADSATRRPA